MRRAVAGGEAGSEEPGVASDGRSEEIAASLGPQSLDDLAHPLGLAEGGREKSVGSVHHGQPVHPDDGDGTTAASEHETVPRVDGDDVALGDVAAGVGLAARPRVTCRSANVPRSDQENHPLTTVRRRVRSKTRVSTATGSMLE